MHQGSAGSLTVWTSVGRNGGQTDRPTLRHIDLPMVSRRLAKGKRPDGLAIGVRTVSPTSADGCHTVLQGSGWTVWTTVWGPLQRGSDGL